MNEYTPEKLLEELNLRASRKEVQGHGFIFEEWVRNNFFDRHSGVYTQDWDIPGSANKKFGDIPVSVKTAGYGSSIGLGDALRQFQINEPFLLIVGFWKKTGTKKRWVNITETAVSVSTWRRLWEPIEFADLKRLDDLVKNRALLHTDAQLQAQILKKSAPFSEARIVVNPKIDSKGQRRLQCSLPFKVLKEYLAPHLDFTEQELPNLFGISAPPPFESGSRTFRTSRTSKS